ncbi:MAG: hypothetical protein QF829_02505, partial [Candidatus Hydrothermarchaeota archaeon]|nr:hypothetical protein [Candidatus Hydrothermarchaeota archaeon]
MKSTTSDNEVKSTTSQLTTSIPGAVKDLKTNWEEEMVYQHPLVYPSYLTLDGEGNIIIASRG